MRQIPAHMLPGGRRQPQAITSARDLAFNAATGSRLYECLNLAVWRKGPRKQDLRTHHFSTIKHAICAIISFTDLVTGCAGKRADGEVIGVKRAALLPIANNMCTRTFSRALDTLHRAGLITKQRRSGRGSLFALARHLLHLLGCADLWEQQAKQKREYAAMGLAGLADAAQQQRAASATRRSEGRAIGALLHAAPPLT